MPYNGETRTVKKICDSCNGSGTNQYSSDDLTCWGCNNYGYTIDKEKWNKCSVCNGTGRLNGAECPSVTCRGEGGRWERIESKTLERKYRGRYG